MKSIGQTCGFSYRTCRSKSDFPFGEPVLGFSLSRENTESFKENQ